MQDAIVIRGRLTGPRSVELDEAVSDLEAQVEVIVRSSDRNAQQKGEDVLDLLRRIPPGTRSRDDIDSQIREEREAWGER